MKKGSKGKKGRRGTEKSGRLPVEKAMSKGGQKEYHLQTLTGINKKCKKKAKPKRMLRKTESPPTKKDKSSAKLIAALCHGTSKLAGLLQGKKAKESRRGTNLSALKRRTGTRVRGWGLAYRRKKKQAKKRIALERKKAEEGGRERKARFTKRKYREKNWSTVRGRLR